MKLKTPQANYNTKRTPKLASKPLNVQELKESNNLNYTT